MECESHFSHIIFTYDSQNFLISITHFLSKNFRDFFPLHIRKTAASWVLERNPGTTRLLDVQWGNVTSDQNKEEQQLSHVPIRNASSVLVH